MGASGRTTRRGFVAAAAGAAAGVAGVEAATGGERAAGGKGEGYPLPGAVYPDRNLPFGDPFKEISGGTLKQAIPPNRLIVQKADGDLLVVETAPDVYVFTDRDAKLGDLVVGERIAVEGESVDGVFRATAVVSQLADIRTRIHKRRGDVLETAAGRVRLTPRTIYRTWQGGPEISPGSVREGLSLVARIRVLPGRDPDVAIVKAVTAA